MASLLSRLDRLHALLARLLVPPLVRRLDRRVLLRHPLLWRSRLLPALCFALPASALAAAAGFAVPMQASNAWSLARIELLVAPVLWLTFVLLVFWARLQLRYPLGERGAPTHWRVALLNLLAATALLLPAPALQGALGERVAGVLPGERYEALQTLLRRHAFWSCMDEAASAALPQALPELHAALATFGFITTGEVAPWTESQWDAVPAAVQESCTEPAALVILPRGDEAQPQFGLGALAARVNAIGHHQALGWGSPASYAARVLSWMRELLAVIVIAVVALWLYAEPRHVWQRRLVAVDPVTHRRRIALRPWRPAWLDRLDRWLLLHRPMFWATRAHLFLFYSVTAGVLASVLFFGLLELVYGEPLFDALRRWIDNDTLHFFAVITLIAAGALLWAATCRRREVPASNPSQWRGLTGSFFLACLPMPFLFVFVGLQLGLMEEGIDEDAWNAWSISLMLSLMAASPVVAAALVANYGGWLRAAAGMALGLPMMAAPFLLTELGGASESDAAGVMALMVVAWMLAMTAAPRLNASGSRLRGVVVRTVDLLICLAPAACFWVFAGTIMMANDLRPEWQAVLVTLVAYTGSVCVFFAWLIVPGLRALTRARHEPARA